MLPVYKRVLFKSLCRPISTTRTAPLLLTPSQAAGLPPQSTVFVDASWVMPNSPRKPQQEYTTLRIPKARFLDIDEVASHTEEGAQLGLKHMMPEPRVFAQACVSLGIAHHSHVILYDTHGLFSSPRALFMFRAFSHANSSVLNGGLPRWIDEGYQVETDPPTPAGSKDAAGCSYPVSPPNETVIRSYGQIAANATLSRADPAADLVLDARSRGRYLGVDAEPRANLPSGHIPGSFSLPFSQFTQPHTVAAGSPLGAYPPPLSGGYTTLRPPEELWQELRKAVGVEYAEQILDGRRTAVLTCGSGMTAAVLWLGLSVIREARRREGLPLLSIYDESWTGYAGRKESKIITGEE